jgi:type IV pilus assembly protein PilO
MRRDFTLQKRAILGGLAILLLADVVLAAYSLKMTSAPRTPQQELAAQTRQLELLKADIKRAQDIRQKIPAIQKDCEQFEQSFIPGSTGYSAVTAELGSIANKAGIQIEGRNFHQREIAGRGLNEVTLEVTISGEYASVVRFLNGLQRSQNVYAVDSLALASGDQGQGVAGALRVSLHMKTYFRTA